MTVMPQLCARCDEEIPTERLETLPDTQVCVRCAREMGGEFKLYATAERTSKAESIKIGYGSYRIKKVRKPIQRRRKDS